MDLKTFADTRRSRAPNKTRPPSRAQGPSQERDRRPTHDTYSFDMPSLDVRKRAFAAFVKRVTDHAKQTRGWSVPRIAKESGIGPATLYRWINAEWKEAPRPDQIEKFCDALDIKPALAFSILWPGKTGDTPKPEPLPPDPDFDLLQRRLNDPKTPESEKYHIRETISSLVIRGR